VLGLFQGYCGTCDSYTFYSYSYEIKQLPRLWFSVSCVLALGSGERLVYPSNRVRTANPVSVRVRVMVSASLSSAVVPVSKP